MGDARKLACIFLASGHSTRFRDNKLLADFGGRPMVDAVLGSFPGELFQQVIVVTRYPQVAVSAALLGYSVVENDDTTGDMAVTIRKGLEAVDPEAVGCMFSVCDQPWLTGKTIQGLVSAFRKNRKGIACVTWQEQDGNPVLFAPEYRKELLKLTGDVGGKRVLLAHPEDVIRYPANNSRELADVDEKSQLCYNQERLS